MGCIKCGKPRATGRKICADCNRVRARNAAKERWVRGERTLYVLVCEACGKSYTLTRKVRGVCQACYKLSYRLSKYKGNNYIMQGNAPEHRLLFEKSLGRELEYNEVIHHLDENILNNSNGNIILLGRSDHGKLHHHLRVQRVINYFSLKFIWEEKVVELSLNWLASNDVKFTCL